MAQYLFLQTAADTGPISCTVEKKQHQQNFSFGGVEIIPDPTGSVHKRARGKKFDPKKIIIDKGDCTSKLMIFGFFFLILDALQHFCSLCMQSL